jgi:hypothetical protein
VVISIVLRHASSSLQFLADPEETVAAIDPVEKSTGAGAGAGAGGLLKRKEQQGFSLLLSIPRRIRHVRHVSLPLELGIAGGEGGQELTLLV